MQNKKKKDHKKKDHKKKEKGAASKLLFFKRKRKTQVHNKVISQHNKNESQASYTIFLLLV